MSATANRFLESPIIPGTEIGSITIGDTRTTVISKIGKPLFARPSSQKTVFRERFQYDGLSVAFEDSKVFMITAEMGYVGATKEGLIVGMSWDDLNRIYLGITFQENKMLWYVSGINGLSIRIVRPPEPDEIPSMIPYVDEEYQVVDPKRAFVYSVSVHELRYT